MDNDFRENEYGFNEYGNDFSNELNADSKLVDIRIILTNLDYLEFISKAVSNFDLSNFNVNISSIIPTSDIGIAKNTIVGADLVLVAAESNAEGHKLYQSLKKALKNDLNLIEYLKLPSLEELNDYEYDYNDENIFEDEIANSIIRGGLYSISNLSSINNSKRKYMEVKKDFEEESIRHEKTTKENDILIKESKAIRERNEKLVEEVKILQRELDKIKSDYSDLKSRFEGIHSKNSLEVYSLNDLWYDLFNEYLSQQVYKFILISTDNFRPKNLMIGQGAICAESKEDALDWLKIIKTAFILADTNKQDLDYNNFKSNFKFEDIEEFGVSGSVDDSINSNNDSLFEDFPSFGINDSYSSDSSSEDSIFNNQDNLIDSSDDGFIYNERFEGNSEEDKSLDDIFKEKLNVKENEESINVFNLKSLKSIENDDEEEEDSLDDEINRYIDEDHDEDYDYDDEGSEEESEDYSPFSNFWS
ncbi:MAG: hypothetical protein MJ235_07435 [archaeon]|nr:hypothetical protein [archaeon]